MVRHALAELYACETSVRLAGQQLVEDAAEGGPSARGSVVKLASSQLAQRGVDVAALVFGDELAGSDEPDTAATETAVIEAMARGIAGGTSEIQRNIIAQRLLGLPKDPGPDRNTPFDQLRLTGAPLGAGS
jgi:alkylation response protein AidB-like acyl-CoA dehydrogenase